MFRKILFLQKRCHVTLPQKAIKIDLKSINDCFQLDLSTNPNVIVKGWVRTYQNHKIGAFISIIDGSCSDALQVIVPKEYVLSQIAVGTMIKCKGQLVESIGKGQNVELQVHEFDILGECPSDYPVKSYAGRHPNDYLRHHLHLRCRTERFSAMMRLRNAATHAIHRYFQDRNFLEVHTPILTSNDCEGAGETFLVKPAASKDTRKSMQKDEINPAKASPNFFKNPSFLTVSGQLHLEVLTGAFHKVYNFSPAFRANPSIGTHHLAEFYMVEAEMNFTESIEDINQVIESLLKYVTSVLLENHIGDLHQVWRNHIIDRRVDSKVLESKAKQLEKFIQEPFIRLDYADAITMLQKADKCNFEDKVEWGMDLKKSHEYEIVAQCLDVPVFVQNFPATMKPFYCRLNKDQKTASCVDLLAPGVGELCGGSIREHRYDVLDEVLTSRGLQDTFDWYLDLRKYGSAEHGGFGLGFERYLMMALGFSNIKDTIPFPRSPKQCRL